MADGWARFWLKTQVRGASHTLAESDCISRFTGKEAWTTTHFTLRINIQHTFRKGHRSARLHALPNYCPQRPPPPMGPWKLEPVPRKLPRVPHPTLSFSLSLGFQHHRVVAAFCASQMELDRMWPGARLLSLSALGLGKSSVLLWVVYATVRARTTITAPILQKPRTTGLPTSQEQASGPTSLQLLQRPRPSASPASHPTAPPPPGRLPGCLQPSAPAAGG